MDESNRHVHGLWWGQLSAMELLCLESFSRFGHQFHLWTYNARLSPPAKGVQLEDASQILPSEEIFTYESGPHKGSYAGFSDLFRCKLLNLHGGWYVDMDVTCLRPLDVSSEYVFRSHHHYAVVGNVIKAPKGSQVMQRAFDEMHKQVTAVNCRWQLPIAILAKEVSRAGLLGMCQKNFANQDSLSSVVGCLSRDDEFDPAWFVFHWCNEYWRMKGWNKNEATVGSRYERLLRHHGIPYSPIQKMRR